MKFVVFSAFLFLVTQGARAAGTSFFCEGLLKPATTPRFQSFALNSKDYEIVDAGMVIALRVGTSTNRQAILKRLEVDLFGFGITILRHGIVSEALNEVDGVQSEIYIAVKGPRAKLEEFTDRSGYVAILTHKDEPEIPYALVHSMQNSQNDPILEVEVDTLREKEIIHTFTTLEAKYSDPSRVKFISYHPINFGGTVVTTVLARAPLSMWRDLLSSGALTMPSESVLRVKSGL